MNQLINDRLALFTANAQAVKSSFSWQEPLVMKLAALLYTFDNKPIDCNAIRECRKLIKKNTRLFSVFRGNMSLSIATMLSLKNNREQLFCNTISVYDLLKAAKLRGSDYLTVAAFLIASSTEHTNFQHTVERAMAFYSGMKKQSWFHTGQDDYVFATMLGLSDIDVQVGAERIVQLYRQLKPEFKSSGNSVQALSHVLVLGEKTDVTVDHMLTLYNTLRLKKIKFDKEYTLPVLGVLALLPVGGRILAEDIFDAQGYLKAQKGFGSFSINDGERLLFSSAIISSVYAEDMKNNIVTSVSTSITSIIIAQQATIIAASAAATVASTSSDV